MAPVRIPKVPISESAEKYRVGASHPILTEMNVEILDLPTPAPAAISES
jgi:hypothetical protein